MAVVLYSVKFKISSLMFNNKLKIITMGACISMMPKFIMKTVILSLLICLVFTGIYSRQYSYVGVKVCAKCHSEQAIGNQYGKWRNSPHARAYLILKTEQAEKIAGMRNITEPWKEQSCLQCHTTGGGKTDKIPAQGVGCEACHGPGSVYNKPSVHVNFSNRKSGYERAKRKGMYPVLDFEPNLKNREKLCLSCHHFNRPCAPKTHAGRQKQQISIYVIDRLKKGNVNFSHKLQRY